MSRERIIAGNWKMHKGLEETAAFCRDFTKAFAAGSGDMDATYVIFPQAAALSDLKQTWASGLQNSSYSVGLKFDWGAQNIHWETSGAFTGELSPQLARELDCGFALAGHSERRQFFGESDETAAKRALAAHENGMRAIFCVGESLADREAGNTFSVLERQCGALTALASGMPHGFVVAYEPVWAIGTGKTATAAQAEEAHAFLRGFFAKAWGDAAAATLPILYGGSVKPQNSAELLACENIDGVLVGGASLDPESFFAIAANAKG